MLRLGFFSRRGERGFGRSFFGRDDAEGRDGQNAIVKTHRKVPLLLLIRKINQLTEFLDQALRRRVRALGRLHLLLMLAVAETHDLDEAVARFALRPVGAGLLITLELIASQLGEGVAE